MKRDNLIKRLLVVVVGASLIYSGVFFYKNGVAVLNQRAIDAFSEALKMELANKNIKKDTLIVHSQIDISDIGQAPKIVGITKITGRKEYKVSTKQHQKNVAKDADTRMLHSLVLESNPIVVDSLNAIWQRILKGSYFIGKTALRMSTAHGNGHTATVITTDSIRFASVPPLFICYLGYGCEIEVAGFFDYSCWYILGRYVIIRVLLLFVICALAYFSVAYLRKRLHYSPVVREVIVNQLVRDMPKGAIRVYQLKENLVFDAEKHLLIVDGQVECKLPLQRCTLLEMLLNTDEYKLSDDVIMEQLWSDRSGTSVRLQQVIKRLRQDLSTVDPSIHIERVHPYSYQLSI